MIELNLPAWMSASLCAQTDPELFHPEGQGASARQAKLICARCPVKAECLDFALSLSTHEDRHGVYGGTTERERRQLRRDRKQAA